MISAMAIDKVAALKRTPLFEELDHATLQLLAQYAAPRHYRKDEVLFLAGEKAHGLFVIVNGSVRAFRESLDGREQVIHVERAGATVAEVPVFDEISKSPRVGSVREVISRALSRLQHDGLIVLEDRKLRIPDVEALSSFADQSV